MADEAGPLIKLNNEDAANAPSLSYNVPDPTSFPGRSYITLNMGANNPFETDVVTPEPNALRALNLPGLLPREDDGGGGGEEPHDPPEPSAVLRFLDPSDGAHLECGENGFDLKIRVRATYSHTPPGRIPIEAIVNVNGADFHAGQVGTPSLNVRDYAVSARVRPGTVTINAHILLFESILDVLAPRTVQVTESVVVPQADTSPPNVTVTSPQPGDSFVVNAAGAASFTVTGTANDPDSPIASCQLVLDGVEQALALDANGSFSQPVSLTTTGPHQLKVVAVNQAQLPSSTTVSFSVRGADRIPRHRLMLVECLRLSNFLGRYGAGRIVQTFSLLPGEQTTITIRSFTSTSTTATETSSIFDSYSETTGDELSKAVSEEDTTKTQSEEDLKANVNVKAGAAWGWGSASVEAGLAYGTSSAREQLTKNVTNGASRHAAEKSSKRDVKVETTRTVTSTNENEQTIVRTLANTSLTRTLNFVFRQMTQEFVSVLHLVDVRVAHLTEWLAIDGTRLTEPPAPDAPAGARPVFDYEEVSFPQLGGLLRRICKSEEAATTANAIIMRQLDATFDYRGDWRQVIEEVSRSIPSRDPVTGKIRTDPDPNDPDVRVPASEKVTWSRFDPNLSMTYPVGEGMEVTVPGVILGVTTNTMRTDGIFVDAFMGGGLALDSYGDRLQTALARKREAEAGQAESESDRIKQALGVVDNADANKATIFATVFPPQPREEPDEPNQ